MADGVYLADLLPFLAELNEAGDNYVVVGGLAVGKWAEALLEPEERDRFSLPILSKDLDIRGKKVEGRLLFQAFRAANFEANSWGNAKRKNAPLMGNVYTFDVTGKGTEFSVETLERLPLLDSGDDADLKGTRMLVDEIYLLDPLSLMVCKIHAFNTRPAQHRNNDEKHIAILHKVIPAFLNKLPSGYRPDEDIAGLERVLGDPQWAVPLSKDDLIALQAAMAERKSRIQSPATPKAKLPL